MTAWTEPAPGLHVRQSLAYCMNSGVLVRDGHALVVDPGVLPSEIADVAALVDARAPRFEQVTVAFTHPHWDHVLGRDAFPAAATVAHVGFADEVERDTAAIETDAKRCAEEHGEAWPRPFRAFAPTRAVRGTVRLELGPFAIEAHEVPGHCASQLAFYVPEGGVLFAADMLSDIEIPWLDGPPWVYRRSLMALHVLLEHEDVRVLVPGHGAVALGRMDAYRRVVRDLDYLLHLEQRVNAACARGVPLEQAQAELATMDYLGKDAAYAMNDVHAGNVAFAWAALADGAPGEP